ncbi:putative bifunctional diguanylate cyclase/phosphodiesterase [Paenibacillus daejeonensis]|uniref:putative bifunctional diguanylate cyclase/phosphodiesterase n=1 Tax=Paenibacillus daejeonensis TaxID=135193 RepID=UPI000364F568|nr:bifunctional diguanylate cyclase/phosphodiesterase [Paenibacillus daejeonensis]
MESFRQMPGYVRGEIEQRLLDRLTGLATREAAIPIIEGALGSLKTAAVMLLNLDRFYLINESDGIDFGDAVLSAFAERLLQARGLGGYPICRYGGNTFLFVLDEEDVEAQAERIRKIAELPLHVQQRELQLSVSCGIAQAPYHGKHAPELLRHSDTALHQAKTLHYTTASVSYSVELGRASCRRNVVEGGLRRALELGELRVMFQPQYQAENGELRGVEALLRWEHPELGSISPAEFVPIAEETGLIRGIGEWVIRAAGLQFTRFREFVSGGQPFRLSVNLSAVQLSDPTFAERIILLLDELELPPACLELELTESFLLQEVELAKQNLLHLQGNGVRIALDDFGTGYSSLSYLSQLPADVVKLDKSFVQPHDEDQTCWLIAESIVGMARKLGLEVVAEGVENQEQLARVKDWGCDAVQGYLFCRPLEGVELDAMLSQTYGGSMQ